MREIKKVILHCTATMPNFDIGVSAVRDWHVNGRGWSDIGYHYLIRLDGTVELGRPVARPGAHTKGHNADSIGVCYVGGLDASGKPADTRTYAQRKALKELVGALIGEFEGATVHGHNEFSNKACPCFNVGIEFR